MKAFVYLLQVSACTGAFSLFSRLLLRKFTFFTLNRWYLIATLLLSFLVPALRIPAEAPRPVALVIPVSPGENAIGKLSGPGTQQRGSASAPIKTLQEGGIEWFNALAALYLGVALLIAFRLLAAMALVYRRVYGSPKIRSGRIVLIRNNPHVSNGSFFNIIFLNDEKLSPAQADQVLAHELVHERLLHSVDVLLVRLAGILLWFNPFIYLFGKAIRDNHEYEADRSTAAATDTADYAELLYLLAAGREWSLYSRFSMSPLQDRIVMLFKKPTPVMKKIVYAATLPLIAVVILAFAQRNANTVAWSENLGDSTTQVQQKAYRQKRSGWSPSALQMAREFEKSTEGKRLSAEAELISTKAFEAIIGEEIQKSTKKMPVSGTLINVGEHTYVLKAFHPSVDVNKLGIKPGDKVTIKPFGTTCGFGLTHVLVTPSEIVKDGKVIYKRVEPVSPPTAFLYESNSVRWSDCTIKSISKSAGRYDITFEKDGFTIKAAFDPSQTALKNLDGFNVGDAVRFRFIGEEHTGKTTWFTRNWVSLSKERSDLYFGVQNNRLFGKFYEERKGTL